MFGTEEMAFDTSGILNGLEDLLKISTIKPNERVNSVMVAEGKAEDTWFRKGKFSTALTYMEMLVYMNIINDTNLKERIKAFRTMQTAEDFKHSVDTTPEQVAIAYQLVQDVVDYLNQK